VSEGEGASLKNQESRIKIKIKTKTPDRGRINERVKRSLWFIVGATLCTKLRYLVQLLAWLRVAVTGGRTGAVTGAFTGTVTGVVTGAVISAVAGADGCTRRAGEVAMKALMLATETASVTPL
jgi:hypothetical protein